MLSQSLCWQYRNVADRQVRVQGKSHYCGLPLPTVAHKWSYYNQHIHKQTQQPYQMTEVNPDPLRGDGSDRDMGWGVACGGHRSRAQACWNKAIVADSRCGRAWGPCALHISTHHNMPPEWGWDCWLEYITWMEKKGDGCTPYECIVCHFGRKKWEMWGQLMMYVLSVLHPWECKKKKKAYVWWVISIEPALYLQYSGTAYVMIKMSLRCIMLVASQPLLLSQW